MLLDAAGFRPEDYRVGLDWPDDGLHLVREADLWEIHFHERGGRFDVETCASEDDACVQFLLQMLNLRKATGSDRRRSGPAGATQ